MRDLFSRLPTLYGARVVLRPLVSSDAPALSRLRESERVYRYLPTFLFEKKYPDAELPRF